MSPSKKNTAKKNAKASAAAASSKLYRTANDLPEKTRIQVIALLNKGLADAVDVHMQMKQAHWNVKGPQFIGLHELFDKIHAATDEYVDQIAERAVQLGGIAMGTVRLSARSTRLPEYPNNISDGPAHVNAVTATLGAFAKEMRDSIDAADDLGDADTADLFTDVSRGIDQWLWFVEAHHQAQR